MRATSGAAARWAAALPLLVMADLLGSPLVRRGHGGSPILDRAARDRPADQGRPRFHSGRRRRRQVLRRAGVCLRGDQLPGRARRARLEPPPGLEPAHLRGATPRCTPAGCSTSATRPAPSIRSPGDSTSRATRTSSPACASRGLAGREGRHGAADSAIDRALPRARIAGRPVYALDHRDAVADLILLKDQVRDRLVVEDPTRPLLAAASSSGTARIVEDLPERVVVEADLRAPGYLVLSDTYDPGWSATVDGQPAPIRPAYVAFRAIFLKDGKHTVVFTYRPAGFALGLMLTGIGVVLGAIGFFLPRRPAVPSPDHAPLGWFPGGEWPGSWPWRPSCWPRPARSARDRYATGLDGCRPTAVRRSTSRAGGGTASTPSPGARARRRGRRTGSEASPPPQLPGSPPDRSARILD